MYEAFYGLKEKPFTLLPDPDYLYLSPKHQRALTLLEYGMMNHAGFSVICGDTGAGKTTLIRRLLSELGDDTTVGLITNTHQSFGELLNWVLMAFGLDGEGKSKSQMHNMFIEFLIEQYADSKHTVLIVDEAQNMKADTLEELRMLSNINADKDQVLQVILAGQPSLRETLRQPELMQFAQRISVDYYLEALCLEETQAYIDHRLKVAGATDKIFTDEACQAIYKYSGGTPRLINLLCDTAMVYGFAEQSKIINAQLVHDVVEEQHANSIVPTFNTGRQKMEHKAATTRVSVEKQQTRNIEQEEHAAQKVEDAIARLTERAVQAVSSAEEVVADQQARVSSSDVSVSSLNLESNEEHESMASRSTNVTPIKGMQGFPESRSEEESAVHSEEETADITDDHPEGETGMEQNDNTDVELASMKNEMKDDRERRQSHSTSYQHARHDDVYPIVHVEESPKKSVSLVLLGLIGGMFVASIAMVAVAWMLFNSSEMNQSLKQTDSKLMVSGDSQREIQVLQKERDAALAMRKALELERDAALSAVKAQEAMRAAEMRAAEILAQQEREAEARLREARARARAAERAEQKALERERLVRLKAIEKEAELKAQKELAAAKLAQQKKKEAAQEVADIQTQQPELIKPAAGQQIERARPVTSPPMAAMENTVEPAKTHATLESESVENKKFTANPCNSASAKFLSTCKR